MSFQILSWLCNLQVVITGCGINEKKRGTSFISFPPLWLDVNGVCVAVHVFCISILYKLNKTLVCREDDLELTLVPHWDYRMRCRVQHTCDFRPYCIPSLRV